jgi:hypothetical protein
MRSNDVRRAAAAAMVAVMGRGGFVYPPIIVVASLCGFGVEEVK